MGEGETQRCTTCGRLLDEREWVFCPLCREPVLAPGEEPLPPGMLTQWGLCMCAGASGGCLGMGFAVCLGEAGLAPEAFTALALGPALVGAAIAAWLGPHLMRPARRSFERLLIALVLVALPMSAITAGLVRNVYFLAVGATVGSLALYAHLRSLPADWGLEDAARRK